MTAQPSIFITGAGAGIGAETARLFAANGWRVGASDVNAATLDALVSGLGAGRASAHAADVRDAVAVQSAVDDFVRLAGGRLDAVFANAGVLFMGPHETISTERKNLLVDVNVKGVIHTLDAAFPHLAATPGAHAVTMCSTSAEYGSPQHAVYSATKFFVRGLTEALNVEYREHDIQVSAVFVSYVRTGMVLDAAVKPASIERMGVKVTPDQVARTVWRAVHGNRVHWRVGLDARLVNAVVRLLGAGVAPIYARLTRE
ncbi:MAG: SDR family oxidoreductase [Lysobacterales bacterium]|nr:MAG: SDR family oxidoreductase [Xanthomonadales bacterium]